MDATLLSVTPDCQHRFIIDATQGQIGCGADGTRQPRTFLFSFVGCLSLQAGSSFIQFWPCLAGVALAPPTGSSATGSDGLAEACQRLPSSYGDGAADGTTGLAGHRVQASVHGEAASSTTVPAG